MLFFDIKRQHLIGVLPGLDQLAKPEIRGAGSSMPGDQEIPVVIRVAGVQHLPDPAKRLGNPSPRPYIGSKSPQYRQPGIVAAKRSRQPQCRMQAVPDLLSLQTL